MFLVINGVVGPLLLGGAVATFFTGSDFYINKANMGNAIMPVISQWGNGWHGLDALINPWNVILGLAVFFLARILGALYFINNIADEELVAKCRRSVVLGIFLLGMVLVLFGILRTLLKKGFDKGIWFAGIGTILTVLALLLTAGYNNTAYYPSFTDIQSSLTLSNSCSSQFTLKTMAYVSILVPFVIAYIFYAWRSIDKKKIDAEEMDEGGHAY